MVVTVKGCTALRPRVGGNATLTPYVSYQFPGFPVHDTPFGRGCEPSFDDAAEFPLARTTALEGHLATGPWFMRPLSARPVTRSLKNQLWTQAHMQHLF